MNGDFVAAAVVILIGACFLGMAFFIMDSGGLEQDDELDMEFEDYRIVSKPIMGTNGPVELVTVDGTEYIHATGLGECSVVYEDGSKDTFTVKAAEAVLVLVNGQSQAAYFGPLDPEQALAPALGTGFYFGWEDGMPNRWDDVSDCRFYDFIDGTGACRVGDKGPAFTKAYSELTDKKVIWISLGIPGRTVSYWNPPNGLAWVQDVKIMDAAVPQIPTGFDVTRTIMTWAQGESDYNKDTGYQHYITTWQAFYDAAKESWGIEECYLIEERTKQVGWVNDAFRELAQADDIHYICEGMAETYSVSNGLMGADDTHFSQQGDNSIATAYAYQMAGIQGYATGIAPIYLQETVIECDVGDSVTLEPVMCYKVDGTTTRLETVWNDTLDTATAGIVTVSGTTSEPGLLLDGCPAPLATAYVGYIGYVDGIEYMLNADGGATVIGRDSLTLTDTVTIPDAVEGYDVTAIGDYAFNWGPWRTITMPDTVTSIGARTFQSDPLVQSMYISDGLASVGYHGLIALTFMDNGSEITVSQYTHDPSLVAGSWAWDGTTASTLYKVVP